MAALTVANQMRCARCTYANGVVVAAHLNVGNDLLSPFLNFLVHEPPGFGFCGARRHQ